MKYPNSRIALPLQNISIIVVGIFNSGLTRETMGDQIPSHRSCHIKNYIYVNTIVKHHSFSIFKYKLKTFSKKRPSYLHDYYLNDLQLTHVYQKTDLVILFDTSFSFILGFISRTCNTLIVLLFGIIVLCLHKTNY